MRLTTALIGIPVAIFAGVVAIANRQSVTVSIDPFSLTHPDGNLSLQLPLFVLMLGVLAVGLIVGWGMGTLAARRRRKRIEAQRLAEGSGLPVSATGPKPGP